MIFIPIYCPAPDFSSLSINKPKGNPKSLKTLADKKKGSK